MKLYNVLIKKDQNSKIEDVVLLDEGFSFFAFLFGAFWFLYHKMWLNAAAIFIINLALQYFENSGIFNKLDSAFLQMAFFIIVAYNANHWFSEHLVRLNYKNNGFVLAENKAEARIKAVQMLHSEYKNLTIDEFSSAIVDPKGYRKLLLEQKKQPYFVV
ncbi:MAG: DUF2628 domain-containing protein [Proteobacteria bacterium]|nr:DUF2628 domain-containing protein [Pseudomonadota bacterium]